MATLTIKRACGLTLVTPYYREHAIRSLTSSSKPGPDPDPTIPANGGGSSDFCDLLLSSSLSHVPKYGFSCEALKLGSVDLPHPYTFAKDGPISERSLEALFPSPSRPSYPNGGGDLAQKLGVRRQTSHGTQSRREAGGQIGPSRALFEKWLEGGRKGMVTAIGKTSGPKANRRERVREALSTRLNYNEPVLRILPEALALLLQPSPQSPLSNLSSLPISVPIPFLSPAGYISHVGAIADEVLHAVEDDAQGTEWYTRRVGLAGIYAACELHQISSPSSRSSSSSIALLDRLLPDSPSISPQTLKEVEQFAWYVGRSWKGIYKSLGL